MDAPQAFVILAFVRRQSRPVLHQSWPESAQLFLADGSYGFPRQLLVSQTLAPRYPFHNIAKHRLHFTGAAVESECKFVNVTLQMFSAHVMINSHRSEEHTSELQS